MWPLPFGLSGDSLAEGLLPAKEPCLARKYVLVYVVEGGEKEPWDGESTPGGGTAAMLRLLLRRPRPGGADAALAVPEECAEATLSLELLRTWWGLLGPAVAEEAAEE